jgi:NADH-ubiquinone oxidoreductase chain 6
MYKGLNIFKGFYDEFLIFLTVLAILSGILIIITKNPVVSVLYLILLFGCVACYLIFIGIKFIGISYLLVYVGAVSILFLFILMLLNIRVSELVSDTSNSIPLGFLAIITIYLPFSNLIPNDNIKYNNNFNLFDNNYSTHISYYN